MSLGALKLIVPKLIKSFWRQLSVKNGVLNVGMSHVTLNGSCVFPLIRQIKARAVP